MTRWRDASFAAIDVETTGLNPSQDEVLSVGVVPIDNGRIAVGGNYYRTVRPRVAPDATTVVIHGIRPMDAAAAAPAEVVARELAHMLRGRILVAHVAHIEKAFLGRWLGPVGYRPTRFVDTDVLARLVIAKRGGPLVGAHVGLGAACGHFGLPEHRRHHALGDALTTAQLFLATASLLAPDGEASVAQLLSTDRALRAERRRRWIERTGSLMRRSPSAERSRANSP